MRRPGARSLGGLLVALAMGRPLDAQQQASVDVGFAAARFPDDNSTVAGPLIRLSAAGVKGPVFGTLSGAALGTVGAASGYATLDGGVRTPSLGGWAADFGGELSTVLGSSVGGGANTGIASARAYWAAPGGGSWVRGTGSSSVREQGTLQGAGLDGGAWLTWPRAQLTLSVAHEWTTAQLFTGPFRSGYVGTTPVRYTEALLSLHAVADLATLDVSAGARHDPDASRTMEPTISATAAVWTNDTRAVFFSASHVLPDWVRGADAMDAVSIGIRLLQPTPALDRASRLIPVVRVSEGAEGRVLRVRAPGARSVEVRGDFTDWQDVTLAPRGEEFELPVKVTSGSHRMLLRVDGGAWRPAANTPAVDDDFGGRAGLLVVP